MTARCSRCRSIFLISESELELRQNVSPTFNGVRYDIPPPSECPACRQQCRLAHRNERSLYHRVCAYSKMPIISIYSPQTQLVVYDLPHWWGDAWEGAAFGRVFDFSRPFFAQFADLRRVVPRMNLMQSRNENSAYTNCVSNLKNCYLLFSSDFNRDCCYGAWVEHSRDCYDNLFLNGSELAYECVFCDGIYASRCLLQCSQCRDSAFLYDCRGCSDCYMSSGLRNKQFYFENQPCARDEYRRRMQQRQFGSYREALRAREQFRALIDRAVRLYIWRKGRIVNSSGDILSDAENCEECFEVTSCKDCRHVVAAIDLRDSQDCCYVTGELGYQMCECFPQPFQSAFNLNCYTGSSLYYCDLCMNACSNLFGCIGLKHQEYCILNKQYSRADYSALVPRIINHMQKTVEWGRFFPASLSLFAYNETNAHEEFPLSREQALAQGLGWREFDRREYRAATIALPDTIHDAPLSLTGELCACSRCAKNYKITAPELNFYRQQDIAPPQLCPDCRHRDRLALRNPRRLYDRDCTSCGAPLRSAYAQSTAAKVWCEECYGREVL